MPLAEIEAKGANMAKKLVCASEEGQRAMSCLRALPASTILGEAGDFWAAAYGTPLLPIDPAKAMDEGHFTAMPIISGFTHDESRAIASGMELTGHPVTSATYPALLQEAFGDRRMEVMQRYPVDRYGQPALAWAAIYTDRMFVCPQLADLRQFAKRAPAYAYEFADPEGIGLIPFLPDLPPGAPHSSELPLLFDMSDAPLDITTGKKIPLSEKKQPLARTMLSYWTQFARTGDPNTKTEPQWLRFDPGACILYVQVLTPNRSDIIGVDAATEHQCSFWATFAR